MIATKGGDVVPHQETRQGSPPPLLSPAPPPSLSWGVFDSETSGLGPSAALLVGALWRSPTNSTHLFTADRGHDLAAALESLDCVVTWNGKGYDSFVLNHRIGRLLQIKQHIDLFQFVMESRPPYEKGWKLDDVTERLWRVAKAHPSSEIPGLWLLGEQIEVAQHALNDIYFTRSIFEHLRDAGWLPSPQGVRTRFEIPEWWHTLRTPESGVPNAHAFVL